MQIAVFLQLLNFSFAKFFDIENQRVASIARKNRRNGVKLNRIPYFKSRISALGLYDDIHQC